MKKILVISSNPLRDDNSDTLCARFRAGAAEAGHEVAEVLLGDLRIDPCLGCGNCSVEGGVCPLQDDMAHLASRMVDSEVIVLDTTPRACAMGGPMKNFIDRCCGCRHEIRAKEFCILLTAAGRDVWQAERTASARFSFSARLPKVASSVSMTSGSKAGCIVQMGSGRAKRDAWVSDTSK